MAFDWMTPTPRPRRRAADTNARPAMYRSELEARAGMFYRLGYPPSKAIARLQANVEWDFESAGSRPSGLRPKDIADIVKSTYLRRPAR